MAERTCRVLLESGGALLLFLFPVSHLPRSLMFIPNIRATFSDEQQAHWLPRAEGWEIIGCVALKLTQTIHVLSEVCRFVDIIDHEGRSYSLLSARISGDDSIRGSNGVRSRKQCACFGNHGDICCRNLICIQVCTEEHLISDGWNSDYNLLWLVVSMSMEQVTTLLKAAALPRTLMRLRYIAPH